MSDFKIYESIDPVNITKTPFNAYKQWSIPSTQFNLTSSNYIFLQGIYSNDELLPVGTNLTESKNWDNSYKKTVYSSLDTLYQKNLYYINISIPLNEYVNIFSISRKVFGTKIHPESVNITYTDILTNTHTLVDSDYKLIDTTIDTTGFIPSSSLVGYYGFNEKFDSSSVNIVDGSYLKNNASASNITYSDGIRNISGYSYGKKANFNGVNSWAIIPSYNIPNNKDFAISMWVDIMTGSLSSQTFHILSKRREGSRTIINSIGHPEIIVNDYNSSAYPYDIYYDSSTKFIYCSRNDSKFSNTVSASLNIISGSTGQTHILYQKTGSNLQLYINNSLICSTVDNITGIINNNSDIYLGSLGLNRNIYSGSIDELRIYDTSLNSLQRTSISQLTNAQPTAFQTNVVGNVFYEQGLIVYSPLNKYAYDSLSGSNYTVNYKSTVSLTEHTYMCNVKCDEFNYTTNQSLYDITGSINPTFNSSSFHPYITTIGLYNKKYELVAVAKLSNPIPKLNTVDLNFMIKFDVW